MSKWLRRGFGHQNSNEASQSPQEQEHQFHSEFPSPPRNELPPGTYSQHAQSQQQQASLPQPQLFGPPDDFYPSTTATTTVASAAAAAPQTMVGGYTVQQAPPSSTTSTTIAAMDVDPRHKYSNSNNNAISPHHQLHHHHQHPFGNTNNSNNSAAAAAAAMMKQDPSGRMLDDRSTRGRSTSSSVRMDRSRSRPHSTLLQQPPPTAQQPQQQAYGGGSSSSPPQAPPPQPYPQPPTPQYHHRPAAAGGPVSPSTAGHFGPPTSSSAAAAAASHHHHHPQHPSSYNTNNITSTNKGLPTESPSAQPTYPPPAVTADSPQPSENGAAARRPAYLLHRDLVIGKGSYGQVCIASRGESEGHHSSSSGQAHRSTTNNNNSGKRKKFACKCVMLRNDPKYIAKLQEEVNVLRELRGHENVIRLYDVFCVDNELFIITELGRGGDLFHLLTTHPKHGVTEAYAAKTVAEMLSAVAFLHCRSICHRDLKLENWVLESGKDVWSPLKLIDFGLSTHFTRGQRLSRVVGSSYYVAPEVLKKSYTEACDLWSLGVIVYMLLSGAPPFYGKNDEAIKASIVQGEYTFPHELFRDVSDEAMAFVSTLLSYNIDYRYTADQALTHPWLAANCEPLSLQKAKDGARGIGLQLDAAAATGGTPSTHGNNHVGAPRNNNSSTAGIGGGDPMQM